MTEQQILESLLTDTIAALTKTVLKNEPDNIYPAIVNLIDKPMIKTVLDYTDNNQSETAKILGINRGTLRKRMKRVGLLE